MKKILIVVLVLISISSYAQKPVLANDTLSYGKNVYYVGKEVQLLYGSSSDKTFAFIQMGGGFTGVTPLGTGFSKSVVKIDKVYKYQNKYFVRGKVLESNVNMFGGNKVFIDIEGSIDNKEMKEDLQ